jgi:hypothetical protein
MRLLKLVYGYKEFVADSTLILQSIFMMPFPAETGFIEFKGWCPFKFEEKKAAAKWQSKSYRLIPLLTHLSFRRTMPLIMQTLGDFS